MQRTQLVGRVVILLQFPQLQVRPVVELNRLHGARLVILDHDFVPRLNPAQLVQRQFVLAPVLVALGRSMVVIERHAGADDVQHRRAAMVECCF